MILLDGNHLRLDVNFLQKVYAMLLIGSRALKLRCPQAIKREPGDFDFVCTLDEFHQWMEKESNKVNPTKVYELPEYNKWIVESANVGSNCEFEIIKPGTSNELLVDLVYGDKESVETSLGLVPSIHFLLSIKNTHRFKKFESSMSGFWKCALDWHMMRRAGAVIKDEHLPMVKLREQETYSKQIHPRLNVNKENFFSNNGLGELPFEHDSLHEVVALYDRPAYTYYMEDGEQVKSSKKKFFEVSNDVRLAGCLEEALTLSLERSLIAHPGVWSPDYAFRFALAKASSSITSGFFRTYMFENIFEVINLYEKTSKDYYQKFQDGVKSGKVRYNKVFEKTI